MYNFINPIKKLCQYVYKNGDRGAYVVVDYLSGRDKVKRLFLNADGAKMYETFHEGHSNEDENVISLIQSCRLQNVNVYDYLCDVLNRLIDYKGNLMDLLPHRWKPATCLA